MKGRRRFLKYAGAAVAAGATVGGYYLANRSAVFDRAPIADFEYTIAPSKAQASFDYRTSERTLRYIDPTCEDEISFLNTSTSDTGPLTYSWHVDDAIVAETKDYSAKLPAGRHAVGLEAIVGDGLLELHDTSTDPDSNLPAWLKQLFGASSDLTHGWLVDGREIGSNKDYLLTLPAGEHNVQLSVSDGIRETEVQKNISIPGPLQDSFNADITVDPATPSGYTEKKLRIPIKGICMNVGCSWDVNSWSYNPVFPTVSDDEIAESLDVIRKELGCNAVRLFGNDSERMIRAIEIAKSHNFETVMVSPRYISADVNRTIELITPLAEQIDTIRDASIILNIGNELFLDAYGILPGQTYDDRSAYMAEHGDEMNKGVYQDKLNSTLKSILESVRSKFGGKTTYSKHVAESVKWNELGLDLISVNEYYGTFWDTPETYLGRIEKYTQLGKPTFVSEFGYYTFDECLKYGGAGYWYVAQGWWGGNKKQPKYSQEAQAQALGVNMELFDQTKLGGIFLWALIEKRSNDIETDGIIKFTDKAPWSRKLGFNMYKSYVAG
jgi:hypothetical protein